MNITNQNQKEIGYIDVSRTDYVQFFKQGLEDVFNNLPRNEGEYIRDFGEGYKDGFDYGLLLKEK